MSNSVWPYEQQHARLACSSPYTRVRQLFHLFSDSIQPSHPLLSPSLPAIYLSHHQGLFNKLALHIMWPKYWSFTISPSNEYSGLMSFRIDWFDLLTVQGTLKNFLQHYHWKAPDLRHSAFFMVYSHPYMTNSVVSILPLGNSWNISNILFSYPG